ncbi:uncharacterized protein LOC113579016 isoform X2 [Electrophorus electricus]|uniref:uncharacterized protein LOC113579016 isoform X2 n=1 Tax=Electrophorus electricus TaxID=8005 RepID=UPI0015CFFB7C|nr:uncharacterized protein LOC113579016 isoform X2 [Electrophorus electricus]
MASRKRAWDFLYFIVFGVRAVFCDFVFVQTGQNQTLSPGITNKMDTILWKHINNKVVEYENGNIEWYRFKGKALFNKETGNLTLLRVDATYEGTFEYEIQVNGQLRQSKYEIRVIDGISKPKVTCQLNNVDPKAVTLQCSIDPPLHAAFKWTGPDGFTHNGDNITVEIDETLNSLYICYVTNEVSKDFAQLSLKDCFSDNHSPPITAIVFGTLIPIILGIIGFFGYRHWKKEEPAVAVSKSNGKREEVPLNAEKEETQPCSAT